MSPGSAFCCLNSHKISSQASHILKPVSVKIVKLKLNFEQVISKSTNTVLPGDV